jgi:phosphoglucosamine mutase
MLDEGGGILGGENSGHVICLDRTTTGDGIISALQVLEVMISSGRTLNELKSGMQKYPQCLVNVKTRERVDLQETAIRAAVDEAQQRLDGRGRVLLRHSGTEPLVRVMVEAEDAALTRDIADLIADAVRTAVKH